MTDDRRRALLIGSRAVLLRWVVCVAAAAVLGLPLAVSWAVTHTVVQEKVGTSPTTFTLSTQGQSELRLGIAGTIYVPRAVGPLGVRATVDGPGDPGAGNGDLANYVRPEMLALYTGLFHDPGPAIDQYVGLVQDELRRQLVRSVVVTSLGGGLLLLGLSYLLPLRGRTTPRRRGDRLRAATVFALVLAATSASAVVQVRASAGHRGPTEGVYALSILDGTLADGATTDSPVIRALTSGALAKAEVLVRRQEKAEATYRATAQQDLDDQAVLMAGPLEGETAVIMQSDMHCNTTMINLQRHVVELLNEQHGDDVPAMMGITGDLTTNGTAAEGTCIRNERKIMGEGPVAVVTGNHESSVSAEQMADAGMTVLQGSIEELAGVRVLGDGDPARSELFGGTELRGEEGQDDVGRRLREEADDADAEDRPDLVLVHEAYAAQAFLGVESVNVLLTQNDVSSTVAPLDGQDGIDDVPAGAVFYGHWHRSIEPRVIWNSDGTWTLLMELDTSGGAVDTPTINNFSTPWTQPQQEASFPVLFLDQESRLVTGYQVYRFETDGSAVVEPRVSIGDPSVLEPSDDAQPDDAQPDDAQPDEYSGDTGSGDSTTG
ncbi:metallophosphoesterase [Nocardioides sp.]|uniref:metallophosphoesterase family protein n=1 Tax=Nocardioides sp. TaxID=35761 RepID=UPI002602EE0E|nr:metallophosphoesterase [Nocardioides sp.]